METTPISIKEALDQAYSVTPEQASFFAQHGFIKIKNISMSETQAGEIYSASGGKLSYCQCKKDCLTSKTCKCRKLKKFCGAKCHGGTGNNRFCRNCPPE